MKSIKTKLILSFSILIFAITSIMGGIFLYNGYNSLKEEAEKSLKLTAAEGAKLTESRVETLYSTLEMIAKKQEIENMGWEVNLPTLKAELKKTSFLDIGYVLPTGYASYTNGTVTLISDRKYIEDALKGKRAISDIVISRVTRKPEIEISVPVIKNGRVVGALVARKEADALSNLTRDEGYGEKGYAFMINSEGRIIAYPDSDKVIKLFNPILEAKNNSKLTSFANAVQFMLKNKSGVTSFRQEEKGYIVGFTRIKGADWIFVTTADQQELFSLLPKMIRTILIVMISVLLLSLAIVYLLEKTITSPLVGITKLSKQFAELDLRGNISDKYLRKKDEIGVLSQAFQSLTVHLRDIISNINESAGNVTAAAQQLTTTSLQTAQITEEISGTVENISRGASEQAENTQIGSDNAAMLGKTIEKNKEHVINLNDATGHVNELVNSGLFDIQTLTKAALDNTKATEEIYEIIMQTKESSKQISEASKMISDMAKQTNLLALNASIEAARAGEAGKGFAVVAEEIQKMADQSAASTKYIDDIINRLLTDVKRSAESMERIKITSLEQQKNVMKTMDKYKEIAASMEISEKAVKILNKSEKEMNNAKNEILNMLESLSSIAEQNAAGTQQAASFVEEQLSSAKALADTSNRLSEQAVNLQSIINRVQV